MHVHACYTYVHVHGCIYTMVPSHSVQLDYRLANTSITIPAVTSEVCFTINIIDDELLELNEEVNLTLSSDDSATKLSAVFTINDDDPVEIMFENARYSVNESAGEVPITVAINGTVAVPLSFSLLLFPITANGSDFVDANISKSLALFSNMEELAVRIINDALPEGEETFRAVLMVPEESAEAGMYCVYVTVCRCKQRSYKAAHTHVQHVRHTFLVYILNTILNTTKEHITFYVQDQITHACVRACVRVCLRAYVHACMCEFSRGRHVLV